MAYTEAGALDPARPVDYRLCLPAGCVWAVTWTLLEASAATALLTAVSAAALAVALALWLRRRVTCLAAAVALLALVCSAGGALAVAGRLAAVAASPVSAVASAESHAELRVVVSLDPRPRAGAPQPGRAEYVIEAHTEWITMGDERVRTRVPVVVLASGPEWRRLVPSQRVVLPGRLVPAGDARTAALVLVRGPPREISPPSWAHTAAGRARDRLRVACSALPQPERGLLPALVVGDTSDLAAETAEDFRTTGMTHLLTVSGANLAIMIGAVLAVSSALRLPPWARVVAGAAMIAVFVVVCRPEPSVLRSAVMGAIGLLALALGRPHAGVAALSASVIGLLLFDPELARSYGFALSVLATAGLLVLAPRWRDRWAPRLTRPVAEVCAVALAAQLAAYPVLALLSAEVSLVAVPANILAAPMVPVATVGGFLVAATALVAVPPAQLGVWVPGGAVAWINAVAEYAAQVPHAAVPWPEGVAGAAALAVLLAALAARGRLGGALALCATASLVAALALQILAPTWPPRGWALVACDVGQGDALVLSTGAHRGVVVDTGIDPVLAHRCLRDLGVREVTLLVLTHDDADHVAGVPGVLRHRRVLAALAPPGFHASGTGSELAGAGVPLRVAEPGQRFASGNWHFEVLWPGHDSTGGNDGSVVLRATWSPLGATGTPGFTALLTGDIEESGQRRLLRTRPAALDVDVLKTPHHGARAQEPEFLATTRPRIVITSVGAGNSYGHPAPRTWRLLASLTGHNYRTDWHGAVAVVPGPGGLEVAHRGPAENR